jgi:hypothetical protein
MSGATLALSASLPATYDAAGYGATSMVYTAIGNIEQYGAHGVTANVTKFTPVDTAVVAKVKGSKDYGNATYVIGNVPSDTGQALLNTASESTSHYSAKLTYPSGEIHYLDVLVTKFEFQDGTVDQVQKVSVMLEICRKPVVVAAP